MFRTLTSVAITTFLALALGSTGALACKNNPFNSAQMADDNLPLIASNEAGKCGSEMAPAGKPAEKMACGAGKCGDGNTATSGKPTGEEKKCEGSAAPEGKPVEEEAGKCGGN